MSFGITSNPIDREGIRAGLLDDVCGAAVLFEGWIRNHNEGRVVRRLEYEIYEPLAISEGETILREAREKFSIEKAACTHRQGLMEIGETAVLAVAVAAHRDEAFRACRYIIDEVKHRLPIWKKEYYEDGDAHWVNCRRCATPSREIPGEAGTGSDER